MKSENVRLLAFSRWLNFKLRRDLDECISDTLIAKIIDDYLTFETKRLFGKHALLGAPGKIQYWQTITNLNANCKELAIWIHHNHTNLNQEIQSRIETCIEKLGVIADEDLSSLFVEYDELEQHSFYFSALLALLNEFKGKQGKKQILTASKSLELIIPDHAVIYYLLYQGKDVGYGEERKRKLDYMKKNDLPLDEKTLQNFSRYVRTRFKEDDWSLLQKLNRIAQLEKIRPYVSDKYPFLMPDLEKDKKFFKDYIADSK